MAALAVILIVAIIVTTPVRAVCIRKKCTGWEKEN